jgi:hypothetical protein
MCLSIRDGETLQNSLKNRSARIHNLEKNSMIDGENRVAKSKVTAFFACRYDSDELTKTFCSEKRNFRLLRSVEKDKLFEGPIASIARADVILNSQKTQFVTIRTADQFILVMKITGTYAQSPNTRCRIIESF